MYLYTQPTKRTLSRRIVSANHWLSSLGYEFFISFSFISILLLWLHAYRT